MLITVEIFKNDRRFLTGERLVTKIDVERENANISEDEVRQLCTKFSRFEIHETYVTRHNLLTGTLFQERYDTPNCCSPSSETYWSN
jgi:hypothetical protein